MDFVNGVNGVNGFGGFYPLLLNFMKFISSNAKKAFTCSHRSQITLPKIKIHTSYTR